jgi:hypothetical protein
MRHGKITKKGHACKQNWGKPRFLGTMKRRQGMKKVLTYPESEDERSYNPFASFRQAESFPI